MPYPFAITSRRSSGLYFLFRENVAQKANLFSILKLSFRPQSAIATGNNLLFWWSSRAQMKTVIQIEVSNDTVGCIRVFIWNKDLFHWVKLWTYFPLLVIKTAVEVRVKVMSLMNLMSLQQVQTAVTRLMRAVVLLATAVAAAVQWSLTVTVNQSIRKKRRRADETLRKGWEDNLDIPAQFLVTSNRICLWRQMQGTDMCRAWSRL